MAVLFISTSAFASYQDDQNKIVYLFMEMDKKISNLQARVAYLEAEVRDLRNQ